MEFKSYSKRKLYVSGLAIGILATALMFLVYEFGHFDFLEQKSVDWRFQLRGEIEADTSIVIVTIDEASFSALNQKWPWPRTIFARLIDKLAEEKARVIGLDIIMSEDYPDDQDEELARSAGRAGNVLFPSKFEETVKRITWSGKEVELREEILKEPISILSQAGAVGYLNLPQDSDHFVRRFTPLRSHGEYLYTSFALKIAARYFDIPLKSLKYAPYEQLQLGERSIPLNAYNSSHINYAGPSGKFQRVSFHQVLDGQYSPGLFENSIVLVGVTFADSHDYFPTPFLETKQGQKFPLYGVEIHANIINTILQNRFIRPTAPVVNRLIILLGGLFIAFISLKLSALRSSILVLFIALGYFGLGIWLFSKDILLVSMAPLLTFITVFLSQVVFKYFTEEREKRKVKGIFQKYVSADVVDILIQKPSLVKLGGEERTLTVLFSDLAGFTTYSEKHTPSEMIKILSEYFTDMTDQVFKHQGLLKEYVGDELMAIFGAPMAQPDHARKACDAALDMRDRLRLLREEWSKMGRPPLSARTGVNSGPMLVGNMGSAHRFSYGVLGDHVNLASRLEGLNKAYGTEILIGENTASLLEGSFVLREVDWVRVKGREQPLSVYELVARKVDALPKEQMEALDHYSEGLEAYRSQRWQAALEQFENVLSLLPKDEPSRVLAERCRVYMVSPPGKDWDGVFQQTTK